MSIPEQPLSQRYGRSTTGRRLLAVVVAPLTLALVLLLGWAAWEQAHPDLRYTLRSWNVVSSHEVAYEVAINRTTGAPVLCDVTVQASDHTKVAEAVLRVPAGRPGLTVIERRVRTERPGDALTVDTCRHAPGRD